MAKQNKKEQWAIVGPGYGVTGPTTPPNSGVTVREQIHYANTREPLRDYHTAIAEGTKVIALAVGEDHEEIARKIVAVPKMIEALKILTAYAATHTPGGATPEEGRLYDIAFGGPGELALSIFVDVARIALAEAEGEG